MKINKLVKSALVAGLIAGFAPSHMMAMGGATGPSLDYIIAGKIGEVLMNPYGIAPLTAVIKNGGYVLSDATVRIVPKDGGQEIKYKVEDKHLRTHGGIPIFGLYADYTNTVEVEYKKLSPKDKKSYEIVKETYSIYGPNVYSNGPGIGRNGTFFDGVEVKKVEKGFEDRLYFFNNFASKSGKNSKFVWNNPMGGALEWGNDPEVFILDTKGEVRWYLLPEPIYKVTSALEAGVMMGFKQNNDGAMSWGYGQRYVKYDIMGREVFNRPLPAGYIDFSHSMDNSPNGNYFLRVASANVKRSDDKNVRTVRDVVIEVDASGNVIDEWRMFDILDPYRDNVLKVIDQGAVCLNIDASKAGQTLSAEDLAELDKSDAFGDIVGSGIGRNWLHMNSVDHDAEDDSIILSSRHQSAIIKVTRDKKVKWILGSPEGWTGDYVSKILTPVDSKGKKIKCENSKCEGSNFDWTWTQHTAFKIDSLSKGDIIYVSAFDNGDARGMEQPPLPEMKYSRSVIYKIDQKKMTVEQVWEYGKDRGVDWYSSVTSLTEYQEDKKSVVAYSAVAGMQFDMSTGASIGVPTPTLNEFKWMAKEPSVEIRLQNTKGYQAFPFSLEKAFTK